MKKIFSFVVVLAAVSMVSCCGNGNKNEEKAACCEGEAVECAEGCCKEACCEAAEAVEGEVAEATAEVAEEVPAEKAE